MTNLQRITALLALPALMIVSYAAYLLLGGGWGREYIKSTLARVRTEATFTLRVTPGGGDCATIGSWNPETRTCSLTRDLENGASIFIKDDGITLEGDGRRVAGTGTGRAIIIVGNSGIVVRGLSIEGYDEAVYLQYATRNTISHLTIARTTGHAIHLTGQSNFNAIINNDIGPAGMHGIALWSSHGNFIANNRVREATDAIRLQTSDGNVIALNEVRDSEIEGLDLHASSANRVVFNNILETKALPVLDDVKGANLYFLGSGGNYYSKFDSTAGCTDGNNDGICDAEYKFAIGVDLKPLRRPTQTITGSR